MLLGNHEAWMILGLIAEDGGMKKQWLAHGGNPVLTWMAHNVVIRQDPSGNVKPDKEKSTEKIDGIVASIMALDRATRHQDSSSVYEERGLLEL